MLHVGAVVLEMIKMVGVTILTWDMLGTVALGTMGVIGPGLDNVGHSSTSDD